MQGTGNDFIVIDNRDNLITVDQVIELAPKMCNRRFGIGADGIILLDNPSDPALDYTMTYRNADGSNAGMCGNGARCLALFANNLGLGSGFSFNVHNNIYEAEILDEDHVQISFPMETKIKKLIIKDQPTMYQSHPGTEHIALMVDEDDLKNEDHLKILGKKLRHANEFQPVGTNVNFICGQSTESLELQTYERGVEDLTPACGTGAIAAALTWHHIQEETVVKNNFNIHVKGGTLVVKFTYDKHDTSYKDIQLTGPAKQVFSGEYHV